MKSEGETRAGQGAAEEFGASTRHTRCPGDSNVGLCCKQKMLNKKRKEKREVCLFFFSLSFSKRHEKKARLAFLYLFLLLLLSQELGD